METLSHLKLIGVLFIFSSISVCGPSAEEKEEASHSYGYEDGYKKGHKMALECVNLEGDDAEDAVYYCETLKAPCRH